MSEEAPSESEAPELSKEEYLALYGDAFPPVSMHAFSLPGYKEGRKEPKAAAKPFLRADGLHLRKAQTIAEKQAQYLKEKAELKIALRHAATNPEVCNPKIRFFAQMLAFAGKAPVTQNALCFINSWINNKIAYNYTQIGANNEAAPARSLLQVVKTDQGICDDVARLKLFVLEELIARKKIDLKPSDVRWLGEEIHKEGAPNVTHAAVGVRAKDGQVWILNNQFKILARKEEGKTIKLQTITWEDANSLIHFASFIQIAPAHLGVNGFGAFAEGRGLSIPHCSFNSSRASYLRPDGTQKKTAADRVPDRVGVTIDSLRFTTALKVFPHLVQDIIAPQYTISQSTESLFSGMSCGLNVEIKLVPKEKPANPETPPVEASADTAPVEPNCPAPSFEQAASNTVLKAG